MAEEKIKKRILLSGKVQGVSFRAFLQRKAQKEGITGWVKNLSDGRVEAVFSGERNKVEKLIDFARRGPRLARVDEVQIKDEEYKGLYDDFQIKF